jgi:hypothetical protein
MGMLSAIIVAIVGIILAYMLGYLPSSILGFNIGSYERYVLVILLAIVVWILPF